MPGKNNLPPNKPWGTRFDTLRSAPVSPPPLKIATAASTDTNQFPATPSKNTTSSNDSSVFVGSLPPNVDHIEISHRLADHLQDYADIRKVKVIRDHRGGACAFIQCNDSDAAKQLIHDVHARPPPPFLGRNLRFEQARSSRTLLFSYRAPLRALDNVGNVEHLEPAGAMRLFRPAGERYITFLYNAEAVHFQLHPSQVVAPAGLLDNGGMLFEPLRYDAQTLRTIVSAFGPLEHVIPYQPDTPDGSYPAPHDVLRLPMMDPTCWEVKWEQREDSMAALMALRAVPHISVSWAHLAGQRPGEHLTSPFTPSARLHPFVGTPSTWISPLRIHENRLVHPELKPMAPLKLVAPSESDGEGETNTAAATYAPTPRGSVDAGTPYCEAESEPAMMGTPAAQMRRTATTPHSAVSVLENGSPVRVMASLRSLNDWSQQSDDELPPLATRSLSEGAQLTKNMVSIAKLAIDEQPNAPPVLTLDTAMQAATQGRVSLEEAFRALTVSRNTSADDSTAILTPASATAALETPNTPYEPQELKDKRNTYDDEEPTKRAPPPHLVPSIKQKLDHSTIFVGGLEMYGPNAWNEDLIQEVFGRYGEIEGIKLIRPTAKKSAFAFVRYCDTESSARAVKSEHNTTYHNRQIRVQIREHNPQRPFFAFTRTATTAVGQRSQQQQSRQRRPSTEQQRAAELQAEPMRPPLHPRHSSSNVTSVSASPARSVASTRPVSATAPAADPFTVNPRAQLQHRSQSLPQAAIPIRAPAPSSAPPTPMNVTQPQNHGQQSGAGYFVPHQYMMPPFAYPMSFAPYPGLVAPQQGSGHETGTPPAGPLPGVQPAFFPYPYPIIAPPMPSAERPPSVGEQHRAGPGQMPPLMPTSFVQGEHGLMPVYSPEALDRYMHMMRAHSSSGGPPTPSHDRPPHHAQIGPMPGWPGFTYGYPPPVPPASPNHAQAMSWYPPVPFGVPYPTSVPVHPTLGSVPGQPLAPINVNALFPNNCPPPAPSQPGSRANTRSAENVPVGENRSGSSSVSSGGGKRLTAQTRELYSDVRVPIIGAGPPPVPPTGRPPKQQHRKGSASMEVAQASPERGQNVTESRSSPLIGRAVVVQSVQAQK